MSKEINYHFDHIECHGCHKEFCHTARGEEFDEERYCMYCFFAKFGLERTEAIKKELQKGWYEHNVMLWEVPVNELPKEVLKTVPFINKKKRGTTEA